MQTIEFDTPTLNEKGEVIVQTRHTAEQFTEDLGNGLDLDLIVNPAGTFRMGSLPNTGCPDEYPQHFVSIKSFMLGKFLVTQGQWKAIMGKLPPVASKAITFIFLRELREAHSQSAVCSVVRRFLVHSFRPLCNHRIA